MLQRSRALRIMRYTRSPGVCGALEVNAAIGQDRALYAQHPAQATEPAGSQRMLPIRRAIDGRRRRTRSWLSPKARRREAEHVEDLFADAVVKLVLLAYAA